MPNWLNKELYDEDNTGLISFEESTSVSADKPNLFRLNIKCKELMLFPTFATIEEDLEEDDIAMYV